MEIIAQINPTFNKNSDYCIFYNSNSDQHCLIYDFRPIQCQVFPLDYPQFTSIEIPENLKDKYGTYEDDLEDLPMCPKETYTNGDPLKGVMVSEDERDLVAMEKSNYLTSYITTDLQDTDISEILIEIFSQEILNMSQNNLNNSNNSKNPPNPKNSKHSRKKQNVKKSRPNSNHR